VPVWPQSELVDVVSVVDWSLEVVVLPPGRPGRPGPVPPPEPEPVSHEDVELEPDWSHELVEPDWSFEVVVELVVVVDDGPVLPPPPPPVAPPPLFWHVVTSGATRNSWIPACFSAPLSPSLACLYGSAEPWPATCTPSWSIVTGTPPIVAEATEMVAL
jgi:hypothetical protein